MKRIALIDVPDPRFQPGTEEYNVNMFDYRQAIEQCLRIPLDRKEGATIDEMRKSIRVLDRLDATTNDVLELEDADWEFLKTKVEKMPWAAVDRRFLRFYEDIVQATEAVRDPNHANSVAH
jgi:hypothetical protein